MSRCSTNTVWCIVYQTQFCSFEIWSSGTLYISVLNDSWVGMISRKGFLMSTRSHQPVKTNLWRQFRDFLFTFSNPFSKHCPQLDGVNCFKNGHVSPNSGGGLGWFVKQQQIMQKTNKYSWPFPFKKKYFQKTWGQNWKWSTETILWLFVSMVYEVNWKGIKHYVSFQFWSSFDFNWKKFYPFYMKRNATSLI